MAAYVILMRERVRDADEMAVYGAMAATARDGHALTALAAYGACETLEGAPVEGAVLLRFPDMAAARAWYDSPAYADARHHRFLGADYRVFITEGL